MTNSSECLLCRTPHVIFFRAIDTVQTSCLAADIVAALYEHKITEAAMTANATAFENAHVTSVHDSSAA